MKIKIGGNDVSNDITEISGVELAFSDDGGYVLQEVELRSNTDYDIGEDVKIYNDSDVCVGRYTITDQSYDYENSDYMLTAIDILSGLKSIYYSDYGFFTDYPYVSNGVIDTAGTINGGYYNLTDFMKYIINKATGISKDDIIFSSNMITHFDGNYELYNTSEEFQEYRNIIKLPLSHLVVKLDYASPAKPKTCFDLLNSIIAVCGLTLCYYNDKLYFKKKSTYSLPADDNVFEKDVELLPSYSHVMMKDPDDGERYYPDSSGTEYEIDRKEFKVLGWFEISDENYPCYNYDHDLVGRRYFMTPGAESLYSRYKINDAGTLSSTTESSIIGFGYTYIEEYYLYSFYECFYKGLKRSTLKTDLFFWSNSSVDPQRNEIDFDELNSNIEVII